MVLPSSVRLDSKKVLDTLTCPRYSKDGGEGASPDGVVQGPGQSSPAPQWAKRPIAVVRSVVFNRHMSSTTTFTAYTVTLDTPNGIGQLDLKASDPDRAGRRAVISACAIGWGDLDTVTIISVEPCLDWEA